jgi:hypothetical protein
MTTWNPEAQLMAQMTDQERQAKHMRELEHRWRTGQALTPEQMWRAGGGNKSDGDLPGYAGLPFPGSPAWKRMEAAKAAQVTQSGQ